MRTRSAAHRARQLTACALAAVALLAAGCSEDEVDKVGEATPLEPAAPPAEPEAPPAEPDAAKARGKPTIAKPTGAPPTNLVVDDLIEGKGAEAAAGDQLTVNYVGVSFKTGKEFDSSFNSGMPFEFQLGQSQVIPGWDKGLAGMRVGGRRRLTIPPDQAYGAQGSPPAIGPNETLLFVIDLLGKG